MADKMAKKMTMTEIRPLAESYIKNEQQPVFRQQVVDLLRELDAEIGDSKAAEELYERFYKPLDFGTGGLRGEIGGGRNRMNAYTVRRATQGLAQYICQNVIPERRHVSLAYDSRNYSDLFAKEAALILAANGIRVSIFTGLRPTPELSFAVRRLHSCAGIVVTASHNPAKYNGYKVYWDDGSQVVAPHDKGIIAQVNAVSGQLPSISEDEALSKGLLQWIDKEVDEPYLDLVATQFLRPELVRRNAAKMQLVYTPLHGAGRQSVEAVLQRMGFSVFTVPEQAEPNGDFPTAPFPNPEIAPAMELALKHAKERRADLVLGTDPDADRLGIAAPNAAGEYILISGNQLGAMLCDYLFRTHQEQGSLPANAGFINTVVSSNLQNLIAQSYGVTDCKVLTGFKFIAAKIREWEQTQQYIFGCEESYGYLVGDAVRDKDAISACAVTVEMALWNLQQGRSLLEYLNDIYRRYGYHQDILIDRYFEGAQGIEIMNAMMARLRRDLPRKIGDIDIATVEDYAAGTTTVLATGETKRDIDLPQSNVLKFFGADGSAIAVRPSGTEPKIKFYAGCCSKNQDLTAARAETAAKIAQIEQFVHQQMEIAQGS